MKSIRDSLQKCAVLAAVSSALIVAGCGSLEQNMAESAKKNIVPGKTIHLTDMHDYPFCEIAPIFGFPESAAVAEFYNSTGGSCPPDKIAAIAANKGESIKKAMGAEAIFINPLCHWTFNEFWVFEVGELRDFEGVEASWMGVVPVEVMKKAVGRGHYHPGQIRRNNTFKFDKGETVYLLDMPDGKVLVMQSWTTEVIKDQTRAKLKDLGSQFKELPPGWKFRVKVLDRDLTVHAPAPNYGAWVTQDEFNNTYQGCGYDTACNYTP
jgi:hypothetical protein